MMPVNGEVKAVKTTNPTFYKLASLLFKRGGNEIKWDIFDGFDEVIVIIFNRTRNTLVCTKQFRPGLYYNTIPDYDKTIDIPIDTTKYPLSNGVAIEFCTGFANTNRSLEEVAVYSLRNDCGYEVNELNLKKVATTRSGGSKQTFFFADVTDEMKIPLNKQNIEVIEYTIAQIKDYIAQSVVINGPSSFIFGLMWFLFNKNSLNC